MVTSFQIGDITVDVVLKDIKNIHLSVYPPQGSVRVAAPLHTDLETLRVYLISRMDWIRKQQSKFHNQQRESQREYINRESHYLWGNRYLLEVREENTLPTVQVGHSQILLIVRPGATAETKENILSAWYRNELRSVVIPQIEKWQPILGVQVNRCIIQHMKTKWGSCTPQTRNIHINTELAKKDRQCLEYVLVHEIVHLIEPSHNRNFTRIMDQFLPQWRFLRDELNRAPLGHVDWEY